MWQLLEVTEKVTSLLNESEDEDILNYDSNTMTVNNLRFCTICEDVSKTICI